MSAPQLGIDICSTCKGPLTKVSSTVATCPNCAAKPLEPIDFRAHPTVRSPLRFYGGESALAEAEAYAAIDTPQPQPADTDRDRCRRCGQKRCLGETKRGVFVKHPDCPRPGANVGTRAER